MEEDLKILEEFIKSIKNFNNYADNTNVSLITKKQVQAVKNLIARNEELEVINKMQEYRISVIDERELIPKSKIKEKIEELLKKGNNLSEEERQKETEFLQGKLKAYEELLD